MYWVSGLAAKCLILLMLMPVEVTTSCLAYANVVLANEQMVKGVGCLCVCVCVKCIGGGV